jgi:hypothetical protein
LRPFVDAALGYDYSLHNGIPYPRAHRPLKLLLVEQLPRARFDPLKPVRAAAFAGWVMTTARSAEDINTVERDLRTRIREDLR